MMRYTERRTRSARAIDAWLMSIARGRPVTLYIARKAVGLNFWAST